MRLKAESTGWRNLKLNKIIEIKFGSHLYGTNTENSDLDFKGIYLPIAEDIVLGRVKQTIATVRPKNAFEKNNKDDVDMEIVSLDRFLDLLLQGQTMALDMLFAPASNITSSTPRGQWIMKQIYQNRHLLLNKNVNAFVGYARTQASKYGVKGFRVAALREILEYLKDMPDHEKLSLAMDGTTKEFPKNEFTAKIEIEGKNGPEWHIEVCNRKVPFHATVKYAKQVYQRIFDEVGKRALAAEKNEGIDWKALSHAVRVNSEAQELLSTSRITFPRPDRELLLKIKLGQMPYKEVAAIIEQGLEDLNAAQEKSTLREKPDRDWADQFLYQVYAGIVKDQG